MLLYIDTLNMYSEAIARSSKTNDNTFEKIYFIIQTIKTNPTTTKNK